ncbi:TlpA family protein disulfide reductase [Janibacter corallicola]|uniref:TlpA family protein disulfide reductase n=1 Tax=Janibacter corallicola TaxID=415212 RepID=UPI000834E921|nr:MauE/DoxX family redox-associated membrane protein [Janibacter corallicola]
MLAGPLLLPPLLLAVLLAVSGVAKLRRRNDVISAFRELGMPAWLTDSPAPRMLPWVELVLAGALLAAPAPPSLGVATLTLLLFVAYLVVILRALRFDHPVTCGCFGRLGTGEVSRRTVARNVLLLGLAGLTMWSATEKEAIVVRLLQASGAVWAWLALTAVTAVLVWLTVAPAKGGPVPRSPVSRDQGAEEYVPTPIPYASLVDASGTTLPLRDLIREGAHLLVFVSTTCGSCAEAIASIPEWDRRLGPVRVSAATWRPVADVLEDHPDLKGHLLQDPSATTARIFGIGTPGAVLLGGDGMLAGGPVHGGVAVRDFVADVRAELVDAALVEEDSAPVGE